MKMRRRKFGIGLKIASLLTTIAVVSVGLASWIITAPTIAATAGGTIQVDTVSTNQVTLAGTWVSVTEDENAISVGNDLTEKPVIYYGQPANPTATYSWLTNDDTAKENLTAWLKVTASVTGTATVSNLTVTFTASNATQFGEAIGASIGAPKFTVWKQSGENYVKGDTTTYSGTSAAVALAGSDVHTYIVKVEFSWGTNFDGQNAYEYFNANEYSAERASDATTKLNALQQALNGITYTMTVTAA